MSLLDRKYWTRKFKTLDMSSFCNLFYEFTRWEILNPLKSKLRICRCFLISFMSLLDRKYWTRKLSKLRIYRHFLISFMSLLDRKYWTRKVKTPDKSSFSILFYEFTRWEIMNPAYRITAGSFSSHNLWLIHSGLTRVSSINFWYIIQQCFTLRIAYTILFHIKCMSWQKKVFF